MINEKKAQMLIRTRNIKSALFKSIVILFAVLSAVPLVLIISQIVVEGISSIQPYFFVNVPKPVGEAGGGIANALTGTLILVGLASIMSLPLGVLVGIFLAEHKEHKLNHYIRVSVDVIQGTPSIVTGILVYNWVVKPLGGFSAISGAIALALMMLPGIVKATDETMRLIPTSLKEASLALGAPYYLTIIKVILPASISGILTGFLLSMARIAGETAPILFTAFGNPFVSFDITGPVSSLPQIIFNYAISPYEDWHQLAWGASFVLVLLVFSLNILSKLISKKFANK